MAARTARLQLHTETQTNTNPKTKHPEERACFYSLTKASQCSSCSRNIDIMQNFLIKKTSDTFTAQQDVHSLSSASELRCSFSVFWLHRVRLLFVLRPLSLSPLCIHLLGWTRLARPAFLFAGSFDCSMTKWTSETWWGLMCLMSARQPAWPLRVLWRRHGPWQRFN